MYERFIAEFDSVCVKAKSIWPGFQRPELKFDMFGRSAGQAQYDPRRGINRVRLNHTYCLAETADMLADTIPHEVAHILAFQRYGVRIAPHGAEWCAMFGALTGEAPHRCHDYEDVRIAARKVDAKLTDVAEKMLRELGGN